MLRAHIEQPHGNGTARHGTEMGFCFSIVLSVCLRCLLFPLLAFILSTGALCGAQLQRQRVSGYILKRIEAGPGARKGEEVMVVC